MATENMVVVRGAYKTYTNEWDLSQMFSKRDGTHLALAGLNMTVAKGTIYTLLGPSGCGKTTLLSCIIGRRTMNAGEIVLGVECNNEIGYMPQEVALQGDLSIAENVAFYSNLFNLSEEHMRKQRDTIYQFLQLPSEDSLVKELSGGQQRRVSLYIALLHNPELLVLDEPTVGLDPTLSQRIWEYLLHLSKHEKKTIIITTHYIEEARKSNKIGLMRKGVILEEGNPQDLMNQYGVESLDALFLKISLDQSSSNALETQDCSTLSDVVKSPILSETPFSFHRLKSQLMNAYYWTKRNRPMMFTLLILPLVNIFLFDISIGRHPSELKMGVVNEEHKYVRQSCHNWEKSCNESSLNIPLSCGYLEELQKHKITLIDYNNLEEATNAMLKNEIWGYIRMPLNYSQALLNRLELQLHTDNADLVMSAIDVQVDRSNRFFFKILEQDLYQSLLKFLEKLYESCHWPVAAAGIPILMKDPIYGSEDITFTEFNMPCIVELGAYFLPSIYLIGSIASEKKQGLWERYFASGMNIGEVIMGHVILALILLALQISLMVIYLFIATDHFLIGSGFLYTAMVYGVGFSGISFGALVAISSNSEYEATFVGMGKFLFFSIISGLLWPIQGMPHILQSISWYLPLTLPAESLRSISIRGWDISYPLVHNGFLISLGWTIIYSAGIYGIIKSRKAS